MNAASQNVQGVGSGEAQNLDELDENSFAHLLAEGEKRFKSENCPDPVSVFSATGGDLRFEASAICDDDFRLDGSEFFGNYEPDESLGQLMESCDESGGYPSPSSFRDESQAADRDDDWCRPEPCSVDFGAVDIDACINDAFISLPMSVPKPIWEESFWTAVLGDGVFLKAAPSFPECHRPSAVPSLGTWFDQIESSSRDLKRKSDALVCHSYAEVVKHVSGLGKRRGSLFCSRR